MSEPIPGAHPHRRLSSGFVEKVARRMFERQAATYGADDTLVQLAWLDEEIREFWRDEAASLVAYIEELPR
jgi:hypothetical protein